MKNRRGVALLTALWLVVAIAAVVLEFSLEAKERRQLGIDTAERGVARAAAAGALAVVQAKLDYALRNALVNRSANSTLRSADPWLDVDTLYSGIYPIDSVNVQVRALDLGTQLNINTLSEAELRTFFSFVLGNFETSDKLAQSIVDWRDADDIPRTLGAEKDQYVRAGMMMLPQNGQFREVEDLLNVMNMTPEIYATVSPFLTVRGDGTVNLNTAPAAVLRALPGMTDEILGQILTLRSAGRRITSAQQVMQAATRGRTAAIQTAGQAAAQRLQARTSVDTRQVELTIIAKVAPHAQPTRLMAIVEKSAPTLATLEWKQW